MQAQGNGGSRPRRFADGTARSLGPAASRGRPVPAARTTDGASSSRPDVTRTWRPGRPVDLRATLGGLRRGAGDPTWRSLPGGFAVAWRTPQGPVAARFVERADLGEIVLQAWGPGSAWIADRLPLVLGDADVVDDFRPTHDLVRETWRRFPGWRVPATGLVLHSLVPAVLEQLVTGQEAFGAYRWLVRRYGEPAPGPFDLVLAPTPQEWALIPSWEWKRAGVDAVRAETVIRVCRRAGRLEECVDLDHAAARARLQSIHGVGVWTASEVLHRALGDADAVSFGDYHVAADIGWALVGEPIDDAALAELLEPYAGHRYRVQKLLSLGGFHRPRHGPRMSIRPHTPSVVRR